MRLPKRSSLVTETAEVLREGIASGEWQSRLPGERALCDRLQVSRSTLREALRLLERQQLVSSGAGKPRFVQTNSTRPVTRATREIALLTLKPVSPHSPQTTYYAHELREQLQSAGFQLRTITDPRLTRPDPSKFLQSLLGTERIAAWLLLSVPAPVQQWFAGHGLPALIIGFAHAGVRLPSIDVDLRAVCRHAAGLLRSKGHVHLGLLRQPQKSAGMTASEQGFIEGANPAGRAAGTAVLYSHDATPAGIRHCIDRALASSRPPTGLVVCDAAHALCATSHLLAKKLSVPGDVSVISRDHDVSLTYYTPSITRYSYPKQLFARRAARLAVQLATHGHIPVRDHRIVPSLVPGATV